jgi:hypothetical protein
MTPRHSAFGCFLFAILVGSGCTTSAKKAEPSAAATKEATAQKGAPSAATTTDATAKAEPSAAATTEAASKAEPPAAATTEAPTSKTSAGQPASAPSSSPAADAAAPQAGATAVNPTATAEIATAALTGATGGSSHRAVAEAAGSPTPNASLAVAAPAVETLTPEMVRKREQIEWALRQDEIKNDPRGQWAVEAKASSTYNDAQGMAPYSASQATGAPNVELYGNNYEAWTPKTPNGGIEWLELQFAKPVHATCIRVRESSGSGAIIKVDLFDEKGAAHTVWSGIDPTKDLNYLTVEFPRTVFKTSRVKVTLATNTVSGLKQIDAVQLIGTEQ